MVASRISKFQSHQWSGGICRFLHPERLRAYAAPRFSCGVAGLFPASHPESNWRTVGSMDQQEF
jgi:hypothetical protein